MCDGFSEAGAGGAIAAGSAASASAASAAAAGGVAAGTAGTVAASSAALAAGGAATSAAAGGVASGILGTGITSSQLITGLQIASAVAGLGGMRVTQIAGNKAADRQTNNAYQARADNVNQVNLEAIQAHDSASQKINTNDLVAREASATALASSNGVGGLSVDALLGDISGKAARYNSSVSSNLSSTNAALDNQLQNINNSATSVINQEKAPPVPDYLGTALRIGDQYGTYLRNTGG